MAGSDIGIVREHDVTFLSTDVRLIIEDRVLSARLSVLANHDQPSIEFLLDCGQLPLGGSTGPRAGPIGRSRGFVRTSHQASTTKLAERHLRGVRAATAWADERGWRCGRQLGRRDDRGRYQRRNGSRLRRRGSSCPSRVRCCSGCVRVIERSSAVGAKPPRCRIFRAATDTGAFSWLLLAESELRRGWTHWALARAQRWATGGGGSGKRRRRREERGRCR